MAVDQLAPLPAVLSIPEAAESLRMHRATAYGHIRNGTFPVRVVTVGGRMRVLRSDLERFLAGEVSA